MLYYSKAQKNKGSIKLFKSITKKIRKELDHYFFRIKKDSDYFIFVQKSENGIALYKIQNDGKLLSKKEFFRQGMYQDFMEQTQLIVST